MRSGNARRTEVYLVCALSIYDDFVLKGQKGPRAGVNVHIFWIEILRGARPGALDDPGGHRGRALRHTPHIRTIISIFV